MMKLLIMGHNPRTQENLKYPFRRTKSGKILADWLRRAGIPETGFTLDNVYLTVGEVAFTSTRIKDDAARGIWDVFIYQYPVIVTLGAVAELAIRETIKHTGAVRDAYYVHLPNPIGPGVLKDKELVEECIRELRNAYYALFERTE